MPTKKQIDYIEALIRTRDVPIKQVLEIRKALPTMDGKEVSKTIAKLQSMGSRGAYGDRETTKIDKHGFDKY